MSRNRKKIYKIYNVRAQKARITAVIVSVLCCALVLALVLVFALGDDAKGNVSSGVASVESTYTSTSSYVSVETSSVSQNESEVEDAISSVASAEAETSSKKENVSSKTQSTSTSSKPKTSSGASVATGNKDNYGLPFDVYKEAKEWTYAIDIDKSKPVPLQPAVKDDFFANAMFVGDSITTGIDLYNIVKGAPVVAYTGINSNTIMTRQVFRSGSYKITFLQQMKKYNPKHIYIMLGINGIAFQSKEKFISGYSDFVDAVKKQHPNANIYLQSILPVTANKQKSDSRFANSKINSYNKAILKLAKEKGVYYLDVAESFKNSNGCMPGAASADGIHFGTAYYRRWIEYLRRHVVRRVALPTENTSNVTTSISKE